MALLCPDCRKYREQVARLTEDKAHLEQQFMEEHERAERLTEERDRLLAALEADSGLEREKNQIAGDALLAAVQRDALRESLAAKDEALAEIVSRCDIRIGPFVREIRDLARAAIGEKP